MSAAKKKLSARELREQQKQQKIAGYKQKEADRKEKEAAENAAKEAEAEQRRKDDIAAKAKAAGEKKKSSAKAAGLKSAIYLQEGELLMTAFGRGNEALLSKRVSHGKITEIGKKPSFDAVAGDKQFLLSGRAAGRRDDPLCAGKKPGQDQIGLKDALEKRYFGRTYEDNIHVQIAYCILDIEKILAAHVNNIIYEVNNLRRSTAEKELDDLIGNNSVRNTFAVFTDENHDFGSDRNNKNVAVFREQFRDFVKNPRLGYFGSAFIDSGTDTKGKMKSERKPDKAIYTTLCLLGSLRQATGHDQNSTRTVIYQMETLSGKEWEEARELLDATYSARIDALNRDFLTRAKNNLTIIFRVLGITDRAKKAEIVRDYYDFVVRKTSKNMGFSLKKLREMMLQLPDAAENGEPVRTAKKYDSVRQKLNKTIDFALFEHYKNHPDEAENIISALRAASWEAEKDGIYETEAKRVWLWMKPKLFEHILPEMDGEKIKKMQPDSDIGEDMLAGVSINTDTTYFSKLMYLVTLFQDGKEINDLLTQLLSKFENIASFLTIDPVCTAADFADDFAFFADSGKVADEIRIINSFAHMELPDAAANTEMFTDAAVLLGAPGTREELREYFRQLLDKNGGPRKTNGKKDNGLRNFIASNVVSSRRFKYLVRYINPEKARTLASNRKVVDFVLKEIPDEQIVRYYNACQSTNANYQEGMRNHLAELIVNMSFSQFEDAAEYQDDRNDKKKADRKQAKQAVIRLYLAVIYLLTKNLVYVNARYFQAFYCLERDAQLLGSEAGKDRQGYALLTQKFVEDGRLNKKATAYLKTNLEHSDDFCIRQYRNKVAHLAAIRDAGRYIGDVREFSSYFDLYHYLMQRTLMDQYEHDKTQPEKNHPERMLGEYYREPTLAYFQKVETYKTTCKDFIKALNVPFGYNLSRYKNLCVEGLFDRNRPGDGREEPKIEE